MSLSERISAGSEAAQWVVDEVRVLESSLATARQALIDTVEFIDERERELGSLSSEILALRSRAAEAVASTLLHHQQTEPPKAEPAPSYCYELWDVFRGDYPSPEEAAAAYFCSEDGAEADRVCVGRTERRTAHHYVRGSSIVDQATDAAFDECGEVAGDWLDVLSRDMAKIGELERVVGDWLQAIDPPGFWHVVELRTVTRAELILSGHLHPDGA